MLPRCSLEQSGLGEAPDCWQRELSSFIWYLMTRSVWMGNESVSCIQKGLEGKITILRLGHCFKFLHGLSVLATILLGRENWSHNQMTLCWCWWRTGIQHRWLKRWHVSPAVLRGSLFGLLLGTGAAHWFTGLRYNTKYRYWECRPGDKLN